MPRKLGDSNVSVDFALVRPPTVAYRERDEAAAWRQLEFPATASKGCRIRLLNFEGVFPEMGALEELIVPVGQGIKSGAHGQLILGIVTSDGPVANYVAYLAEKHRVPFFLAPSLDHALESSSPVGQLTSGEIATLETVKGLGGYVTSSQLAKELELELAAAGNRLAKIEKKGYLLRIPRSPREGDIYVDPRQALNISSSLDSSELAGYIPSEIRTAVLSLVEKQGRSAEEVVGEVWREFFHKNKAELGEEFKHIGKLFDTGDTKGIEEHLTRDVDDWAEQAATSWDDQ